MNRTPARRLLLVATIMWLVLFAIMWAPYYIAGIQGQLLLFPVIYLADVVVIVLAVCSIVVAARSRVRERLVIVGATLLIVLGPIALWFGGILRP